MAKRLATLVKLTILAGLAAGLASCSLLSPAPGHSYTVWVLDDADPDSINPPFDDTITIITGESASGLSNMITGINVVQTIGGARKLAVSPDGTYALVAAGALSSAELECLDTSGQKRWSLPKQVSAVCFLDADHAYVLVTNGTISGESTLLLDPQTGTVEKTVPPSGFDLAVDGAHSAVWIVGPDIKQLDLDLNLRFTLDPIGWNAVSVDFDSDGAAWVAERYHPDVAGSANRLLKISPQGSVAQTIPLDFAPRCVRVDRRDGSLWVTGGQGIHKFAADGTQVITIPGPGFTVYVDQVDG